MKLRLQKISLLVGVLAMMACSKEPAPQMEFGVNSAESTEGLGAVDVHRPMLATADQLFVTDISVANIRKDGVNVPSLSFSISGEADYAEFKAVALGSQEPVSFESQAATTRVELPLFPKGKVELSMRACVEKSRVQNPENCGDWARPLIFQQQDNTDYELASWSIRQEGLYKEIEQLQGEFQNVQERFIKEAEQCEKNTADYKERVAKVKMAGAIVAVGGKLMGAAMKHIAKSEVKGEASKEGSAPSVNKADLGPAKKAAEESSMVLKEYQPWAKIGEKALNASRLMQKEPINSLGGLITSMFAMYKGVQLPPEKCFAEKNLQAGLGAIQTRMAELQEQIQTLESKISARQRGSL